MLYILYAYYRYAYGLSEHKTRALDPQAPGGMKMSRRIMLLICFSAVLLISLPLSAYPAAGESVESILGGRTALHWGKDYLAWVVHYPDSMVDPWVQSKTGGNGDPTGKIAKDLRKSLRMDNSTPVLLSVHCFAGRPVNLKPLPDRLYIRKANGEKVRPHTYDGVFDSPLNGLVQGFVYFPRVEGPFRVELDAGPGVALVFEFPEDRENRIRKEAVQKARAETGPDTAKASNSSSSQEPDSFQKAQAEWKKESERLNRRIKELSAERDHLKSKLDSTLAAMASERNIKVDLSPRPLAAPPNIRPEPLPQDDDAARMVEVPSETLAAHPDTRPEPLLQAAGAAPMVPPAPDEAREQRRFTPGLSKEEAGKAFFEAWKNGDIEGMYGFLSPELRESLTGEDALKDFLKRKVLPDRMPKDAKTVARGDGAELKIEFATKILVMRTLRSVRLEMVEGPGGWFVGRIE
jgi:hypothetical protein